MKCPACQSDLQMTERSGIEIDYCSKCRGVWLDRGELDKIIERSAESRRESAPPRTGHFEDDDDDRERASRDPRTGRKRRGFLSEMFDFD